jgi:mRNA-degrading endonuclease toxin of MazEF toxin-antitoxin module
MAVVPGSVCWTQFPYSDLSEIKPRPVVVLKPLEHGDVIVCMITSKSVSAKYAIDFNDGFMCKGRPLSGSIRPDKLFTAHKDNLLNLTALPQDTLSEVLSRLREIFSGSNA